jgi:hypothetical protein
VERVLLDWVYVRSVIVLARLAPDAPIWTPVALTHDRPPPVH